MLIRPPRKFTFTVAGFVPANILTDRDLQFFIASMRAIILTQLAHTVAAIPTEAQLQEIIVEPVMEGSLPAHG